jgi:uncharacterized protein YyaL (SSP411 family)
VASAARLWNEILMTHIGSASAERRSNRLAHEASPYLRQHAKNPVDWYPWGEEALATAKREDKPILLSVGYSACHWCHVMERESFEDEAIAQRMNDGFVCVKVDREERPDLDQIYQLVVQLLGRTGGWPLTVFLTPEKKPFFGGTYFPPADRHGMPGFPKVLDAVREAYTTRRGEIVEQAGELAQAIAKINSGELGAGEDGDYTPGPDLLERATNRLSERFDDANGGFGARPKFPNTMSLEVLLRRGALEHDQRALARVRRAVDRMRAGGIYDQIGGGFHRYSTDEKWLVPHFEKMLYDNALLMRLYADAHRAMGDRAYAQTVREVGGYVMREMQDARGGYYTAQDADSAGEEGKFFVWTSEEIDEACGDDAEAAHVLRAHFGVTPDGNFEDPHAHPDTPAEGRTVLSIVRDRAEVAAELALPVAAVDAAIERGRARLFAHREKREKPLRDEKVLASWNGLMIGAMADGGALLDEPVFVASAERAYAFVLETLGKEVNGELRLARHAFGQDVRGQGFLDDYAYLADAALTLYQVTGDPKYVANARALADTMARRFHGEAGFFFTPDDGEELIVRTKDAFDQAIPSATSIACQVMVTLGALTDAKYTQFAGADLARIAPAAIANPAGFGHAIGVLHRLVRGNVEIVLVGPRGDARTRALARAAHAAYQPNRLVAWADPGDVAALAAAAVLAEGKPARPEPAVYVCRDRACSAPVSDAAALERILAGGGSAS